MFFVDYKVIFGYHREEPDSILDREEALRRFEERVSLSEASGSSSSRTPSL
ncbi:MAG: hypothetical protein K2J78_08405 [Muribaculaceae bacterium]|nr:hypothetical protein [Muribaculaceae bacterium]